MFTTGCHREVGYQTFWAWSHQSLVLKSPKQNWRNCICFFLCQYLPLLGLWNHISARHMYLSHLTCYPLFLLFFFPFFCLLNKRCLKENVYLRRQKMFKLKVYKMFMRRPGSWLKVSFTFNIVGLLYLYFSISCWL